MGWFGFKYRNALACLLLLSGCGIRTPDIQEFWGTADDVGWKVSAISAQVKCELKYGIKELVNDDIARAATYKVPRQLEWLERWGAQMQLTLTIDEKSTVAPTVSFITPFVAAAQTISLGLGASASSEATRIDKVSAFYELNKLLHDPPDFAASDRTRACIPDKKNQPKGTLFLDSELKLREWLRAALFIDYSNTGDIHGINGDKDVISHEIKFEIVSDGNFTPTWKLVRVTANDSTTLFDAKRDRTQDLIVTMGPLQQPATAVAGATPPPARLSAAAQNAALASDIANSINTQFRLR